MRRVKLSTFGAWGCDSNGGRKFRSGVNVQGEGGTLRRGEMIWNLLEKISSLLVKDVEERG